MGDFINKNLLHYPLRRQETVIGAMCLAEYKDELEEKMFYRAKIQAINQVGEILVRKYLTSYSK